MKHLTIILISLISISALSQEKFDIYFTDNSMRVDFILAGNSETETMYLDKIKKEPFWGGSKVNLQDEFNFGEYKFEVFDKDSGKLIYSRGFCTMFEEWQTTNEAKSLAKSFSQTIVFPFPQNDIFLKVFSRNWEGNFDVIYEMDINPNDYFINPEKNSYEFDKILDNGDPAKKVDLVFIAEGYTKSEMSKFEQDVKRIINYVFTQAPYNKNKSKFNIWIVKSASEESGTDIPGKGIYKKTIVNSNFYTFDSERYLTTMDVFSVRDIASVVPYDDICIIVNSAKYGGGGVFNHYAIFSVDHALSDKVFIHEFGHSFAGLGDEYYNSSTSYNDFFNLKIEPWQPNLTTMVKFNGKWESLINETTPVPTPREEKYKNTIGVFEGGGYVNKGMYSPYQDCRMKSNKAESFCPVCQDAIVKMILFKSE